MTKEDLKKHLDENNLEKYCWDLYYFRINFTKNQPYAIYKARFTKSDYLMNYIKQLSSCVLQFQLNEVSEIQIYNGMNSKVTCDSISINDSILKDNFTLFKDALENINDELPSNKRIHGYFLLGTNDKDTIILFKTCNPFIKKISKKTSLFKLNGNMLDVIEDKICRFYLNVDFLVINDELLSFNLKFENVFNIEKTLQKIKDNAVSKICNINAFSNNDVFLEKMRSYNQKKIFITLSEDRLKLLSNPISRINIAKIYGFTIDNENRLIIDDEIKFDEIMKYICGKLFHESEHDDIIEAHSIKKIN